MRVKHAPIKKIAYYEMTVFPKFTRKKPSKAENGMKPNTNEYIWPPYCIPNMFTVTAGKHAKCAPSLRKVMAIQIG